MDELTTEHQALRPLHQAAQRAVDPSAVARSDIDILRASVADPETFGTIFDRHSRAVWQFVARRSGPETADDSLSEVFRVAFQARADHQDLHNGTALPWLYGIARNIERTQHRSRRRQHRLAHRLRNVASISDTATERVESHVDASNFLRDFGTVWDTIDPIDREILLLVAWEDMSTTDIAIVLSMPAGTIKSRLHRLRTALQHQQPRNGSDSR